MALSFESVKKAYTVFNELKTVIKLDTPSWPEDMSEWNREDKENPKLNTVFGWDKKYDNGWENLVFFVKNPPIELLEKFDELKSMVPNTSMCKPYKENNSNVWIFGWF